MSIANGTNGKRSKRQEKKPAPSMAAVHPMMKSPSPSPPVQPYYNHVKSKPSNGTDKLRSQKKAAKQVCYGQRVEPQTISTSWVSSSVAGLVQDVMPQSQPPPGVQKEAVNWVEMTKYDYTKREKRQVGYVVTMGLAHGYQIWWLEDNGCCYEVVSDRKKFLKIGRLLAPCWPQFEDHYADDRPLLAIVDGNPMAADNDTTAVGLLSLTTGEVVTRLNKEAVDIASSRKCLVIALLDTLELYHPGTFAHCHSISVAPSPDLSFCPTVTLSEDFLAYADRNLTPSWQSVGGTVFGEDTTFSTGLVNSAKSIIGSFVGSFSSSKSGTNATADLGIVTVVNAAGLIANKNDKFDKHVVSHFVAHETPVGYVAFGHGGQLLLTCAVYAKEFNVYVIHPHPGSSGLGSVQHLYTLYRGNTAAKVIDCTFSDDNRWVAVSTNHGTTHLYSILPYGGAISMRTHGGKMVNKESRFERTAGLTSEHIVRSVNHHAPVKPGQAVYGASKYYKEHPSISLNSPVYKTTINPRLNLNVAPIALNSVAKLYVRGLSTERITSWATDNAPVNISANGRATNGVSRICELNRKIVARFATHLDAEHSDETTLYVMSVEGELVKYQIKLRQERTNSTSSTSSATDVNGVSGSPAVPTRSNAHEVPISVKALATHQWTLQRTRNTSSIEPPLSPKNPIISSGRNKVRKNYRRNRKSPDYWLQHVELETYTGPHRRLWMGPQFSFGVYDSKSYSHPELISPSDTTSPMDTATKCCSLVIGKSSSSIDIKDDSVSHSILCGSLPTVTDSKGLSESYKKDLADAMLDFDWSDNNRFAANRNMSNSSGNNSDNHSSFEED